MRYRVNGNVRQAGTYDIREIPTFELDGDVLGIRSEEHARVIAEEIVNPFFQVEATLSIVAV